MLSELDKICQKHNIRYMLFAGTALGAVRHHGFIPWDDDVDVWMPREDYMKLLDYLKTQNSDERFVLNAGENKLKGDRPSEFQMRILDLTGSIERSFAGRTITTHPWVDIFALDNFPKEKKERFLKRFKRDLLCYKIARCKNFTIEQNSLFGKINKMIFFRHQRFKLFFFISEERCLKRAVRHLTQYKGVDSEEYFCYAAVYLPKPEKCFFSTDCFRESKRITFEDGEFCVPAGHHEVLTTLYCDYMQLPPEDQRRSNHTENA